MSACGKRAWEVPDLDMEPPEPECFDAHCGDCANCRVCPCGRHGWCEALEEFVDVNKVVRVGDDCCDFNAAASFDPEWREWEAADAAYDLMNDR